MQFQNPTSTEAAVKFTVKIFVHFFKMGYADFEEIQCWQLSFVNWNWSYIVNKTFLWQIPKQLFDCTSSAKILLPLRIFKKSSSRFI